MKKLGTKLREIFLPIENPLKQPTATDEPKDAFQYEDKVLECLSKELCKFYGGRQGDITDKILVLWVADDNKRAVVERCHDRLLTALRDNSGLRVSDIMFKGGLPPKGATEFFDGYAFTVSESARISDTCEVREATVSIHDGKGTLMSPLYEINATGGPYNIGRGAKGPCAISIVADSDDEKYELNKYVRSNHARIAYIGKLGFCLFVERDGTQVFEGSRTQLRHADGTLEELNNPQLPVPLRNGDVIVLGKSVELEYITK